MSLTAPDNRAMRGQSALPESDLAGASLIDLPKDRDKHTVSFAVASRHATAISLCIARRQVKPPMVLSLSPANLKSKQLHKQDRRHSEYLGCHRAPQGDVGQALKCLTIWDWEVLLSKQDASSVDGFGLHRVLSMIHFLS